MLKGRHRNHSILRGRSSRIYGKACNRQNYRLLGSRCRYQRRTLTVNWSEKCLSAWQMWLGKSYAMLRVNCGFPGSRLSRSMPVRKLCSLSSTFQSFSHSRTGPDPSLISEGLKSNQVSLHVFKMKCSWSWYRVLAKARAKHRVWGPNNNKLHSSHSRRCFKGLELQGSSQSKLLHFLSISSVVVDASIRFCRALSFSLKCSASLCRSYLTRPRAWPSDGTDYIFDRVICRSSDGGVSTVSGLISIIQAAGATALALPLSAIGLGAIAIKFLYGKYQQ